MPILYRRRVSRIKSYKEYDKDFQPRMNPDWYTGSASSVEGSNSIVKKKGSTRFLCSDLLLFPQYRHCYVLGVGKTQLIEKRHISLCYLSGACVQGKTKLISSFKASYLSIKSS